MVAQLRTLDPSASAEIGTPERKILDTAAEGITEAQVNLNLLGGALDLQSKFGSDLDAYLANFGFGRQQGSFATGFITFGRPTPSAYNITIPNQTQVSGTSTVNGNTATIVFQTTQSVTLVAGQTSVTAPIQAVLVGSQGNLAANTITQFANVGAPVLGITTVTNPLPTTNGSDAESDAELKVRFSNTVFRNVAGTEDQYLALAVATQFSTKANVIGPISRWQEYVQVPTVDDASSEGADNTGNGATGQYTTLPSSNTYAKYIHSELPYFVSNGPQGAATIFYRQDSDFALNAPPLNVGDTFREASEGDIPAPSSTPTQPNVTFFNVYTGSDPSVTLPVPGGVYLLEYAYLSADSRNDVGRNIANCVDVFVNGQNPTSATAVLPPTFPTSTIFTVNGNDKFYAGNFRRLGQPTVTPTPGNFFSGLFWQPVIGLPSTITVGSNTFHLNTDYWCVTDITLLGGTVRARNGIEWSVSAVNAIASSGVTSFSVVGYTYDANIVDLQSALDGSKQVTTDILAHAANQIYYKLDISVVYSSGASIASTNTAIQGAVASYFNGAYFGSTILLSDLLASIRAVNGVSNVRWSNDVQPAIDDAVNTLNRVTQTDVNGNPLSPATVYNRDFNLRDSQLPALPTGQIAGDAVPGLIIRQKAQGSFYIV